MKHRSLAYIVLLLAVFGFASASQIEVIQTMQLSAPVSGAAVRFPMPIGWKLHSVRTGRNERTIVPITATPEAAIHIYPLRDPQHRYTESDFAKQYLASERARDKAIKVRRWGSVETSRYGVVALSLFRTPHSPVAARVFGVVIHGSTYVRVELAVPALADTAKYGSTLRELIGDLIVNDI